MFRTISQLSSLNIYRDGGSVSASFRDDKGVDLTLMFRINIRISERERKIEMEKLGYLPPILDIHYRKECVSPGTGLSSFDWDKEEKSISWDIARSILKQLKPLVDGLEPQLGTDYRYVYPMMVEIADNEGHMIEGT